MITYFKDKNHKSTKKYKNYKTLTSILDSVDTVIIGANTTSVTLSVTGVGLIVVPISAGIACALSSGNNNIQDNKNKKQYQKDQQTIKSVDRSYRKYFQDNLIDQNENDSSCNFF